MNIKFNYKPFPVHRAFHESTSPTRVLFGAMGSGKTYALCAEVIAWALENPGARIMLSRFTASALRDTTEPIFFELLPTEIYKHPASSVGRAQAHYEHFRFPNGSLVIFRGLDDWNKHRSLNLSLLAIDEASEIDEDTFVGMSTRIRQQDPTREAREQGAPLIKNLGIIMATNPNGKDWLYRNFVKPESKLPNAESFMSTTFDNPYLPPEYFDRLKHMPPNFYKRNVLCQFDDFADQVYEDWGWDTHVIKPYTHYPDQCGIWMACDPALHQTAGLWVVNEGNRLVGVAEYSEPQLAALPHAKAFRELEAAHKMTVTRRVADPIMNAREKSSALAPADVYRNQGFSFEPGAKWHKTRIPVLGQLITNKQFVVTEDCPRTYEQIKNYKWKEASVAALRQGMKGPEQPVKKDDDLVDCAQYLAGIFRPQAALVKTDQLNRPLTANELFSKDVHARIKQQRAKRETPRGVYGGII